MKNITASIIFFLSVIVGRAEWITFQIPLSKADHEIRCYEQVTSLSTPGASSIEMVSPVVLSGTYTSKLTSRVAYVGGQFTQQGWQPDSLSYAEIQVERTGTGEFLLYDATAQEWSPKNTLGLANSEWTPANTSGGTNKIFFALPSSMISHEFSAIHSSGAYQIRVNKGLEQGEYDNSGSFYSYGFVSAWVDWPVDDAGSFHLLDHTSYQIGDLGQTDFVGGGTWVQNPFPPLLVQVDMILSETEINGDFYVYLDPSAPGSLSSWNYGGESIIASDFDLSGIGDPQFRRAKLSFQMPVGIPFKMVRTDYDEFDNPIEVLVPNVWTVWGAETIYGEDLFLGNPGDGVFHNWQTVTFHLGMGRYDAFLTPFWTDPNGNRLTEIPLSFPEAYSMGRASWIDEFGTRFEHDYWIASATIDSARSWSFFEPGWSSSPSRSRGDVVDWSSTLAIDVGQGPAFYDAPYSTYGWAGPSQQITLLFPPDRSGSTIVDSLSRNVQWLETTSQVQLYSPFDSSYFSWQAPAGTLMVRDNDGDLTFTDQGNGDVSSGINLPQVISYGAQPLLTWFKKGRLHFNVSSSRWRNQLVIRAHDGTEFAVKKNRVVGDLSLGSGSVHFNSYGFFDAEADYYPSLPFAIYDATRGEYLALDGEPVQSGPIPWIAPGLYGQLSVVTRTDDYDSDGDGLPDYRERELGTNPYSNDTDGDMILDGVDEDPLRKPSGSLGSTLLVFTPLL